MPELFDVVRVQDGRVAAIEASGPGIFAGGSMLLLSLGNPGNEYAVTPGGKYNVGDQFEEDEE